MRLRYRIGVVGLLVVVAAALLWAGRSREPSYQGKRLSQWMDVLAHSRVEPEDAPHKQATEAIRHIGTNALPILLAEMQYKEPPFDKALLWLNERQSLMHFRVMTEFEHAVRAACAFRALGPAAKPAIPALAALLDGPEASVCPAAALAAIGPESLQTFTNALTNQNPAVRTSSLSGLGFMGGQAEAAVPDIIGCLNDNNASLRRGAVWSLGKIHKRRDISVPALITCLEDKDGGVRLVTAMALAAFGAEAKPAVPALLKLCNDPDEGVRYRATNALKKIDPEAAAKSGIR